MLIWSLIKTVDGKRIGTYIRARVYIVNQRGEKERKKPMFHIPFEIIPPH